MLSERLASEINIQIKYEFYSAHLYMAMAAYCDFVNLEGFANFYKVQAEEERFHAMKFYDFMNQMNARVTLEGLDSPENNYSSILDTFKRSVEHEKFVTSRIYTLMDIATEEREHATVSLLKWFIDEQVEEENSFNTLLEKIKRIGDNSASLYMLDDELAQRVFTPPIANAQA